MRKLTRSVESPKCLAHYKHGLHNWNHVEAAHKLEIWEHLNLMQNMRCAYCERIIQQGARHIEHFFQKGRQPKLTFDWSNLFGSCTDNSCCGFYKDRQDYLEGDILKPDIDDPVQYLVFAHDGTISPRLPNTPENIHRANETLRVFNLDHHRGPLRYMRQRAASCFKGRAHDLNELCIGLEPGSEIYLEFLHEYLDDIANEEFISTLQGLIA